MSDIVNIGLADTGVLTVRLNRPEVLNSLNRPIVERLIEVLNDADKKEAVRAIIVTGEGRGFCAGADWQTGNGLLKKAGQVGMLQQMPWKPPIIRWCAPWCLTPSPW